jgi:hypothetical protein
VIQGILLCWVAQTIFAPARTIPCLCASRPTMKPGSSAKQTIGRWNVLQSWMKRMTFVPAATSIEPPRYIGLLIITPTG